MILNLSPANLLLFHKWRNELPHIFHSIFHHKSYHWSIPFLHPQNWRIPFSLNHSSVSSPQWCILEGLKQMMIKIPQMRHISVKIIYNLELYTKHDLIRLPILSKHDLSIETSACLLSMASEDALNVHFPIFGSNVNPSQFGSAIYNSNLWQWVHVQLISEY